MNIVVDTNILLSALLKPSTTQKLLFSEKTQLFAPEHCLKEVQRHSLEFAKRMDKSKKEVELALTIIFAEITIIPSQEYKSFKKEAKELLSDKKDWPFLALALSLHYPIWSNDKGFKEQSKAKTYSTRELIQELT